MTTLRILPPTLVNRIAAGEVIERPASVIKELVENAIDAGATHIDVLLEQAGKNRIVVQDNGKGMSKEELALSVQRHATSKLPGDDLLDIRYLGFRGEALPSIGSISRLTITSRTANSDSAWSLHVEGGNVGNVQPAVLNKGTRVEVCDLFYSTPVRLKFLKSDRTEIQQVVDTVTRLAMVHPEIAFSVTSDEKKVFAVDSKGDLLDASLARLTDIMGKEFSDNALALDTKRENLQLKGFAALPTFNRGTSAEQYLFVNQRPVRDKLLLGSIRGAYQDVLPHDRHAVVVLFLEVPAQEVDVNVHPTKAEVRFRDSNQMRGLMVGAIKHALSDAGFRASNTVGNQALQNFSNVRPHMPTPNYDYRPTNAGAFYETTKSFFEPLMGNGGNASLLSQDMLAPLARPAEQMPHDAPDYTLYPLGAARCQLHKTYIVAETVDGLVIVDQHAAHERLVCEDMKASLTARGVTTQKLLLPEVVELGDALAEALLSRQQELQEFGLVIESFGSGSVVVRETPALLGEINVAAMVHELADNIREFGEVLALKEKIEELCGTMACYSSIRAGRALTVAEMNALLRQMEQTPFSGQCNHGRPTYIELKRKDIERLFGRT